MIADPGGFIRCPCGHVWGTDVTCHTCCDPLGKAKEIPIHAAVPEDVTENPVES